MPATHPAPRRRRAATTVELAVVLVPFLLVVFAVFEYGRYTMMRHLVTSAAREGARLASVNTDVTNQCKNKTPEEVQRAARAVLANQLPDATIRIYRIDNDGKPLDGDWETTATYQQNIAVEVSAAYRPLVPTFRLLPNGLTVRGKAVMKSEGG